MTKRNNYCGKFILFMVVLFTYWLNAENKDDLNMDYLMPLLKGGQAKEAMSYLMEHLDSESRECRTGVYNTMNIWIYPNNPEYRKQIVEVWTSKLDDVYSSSFLYKFLSNASPTYFTDKAKQNILTHFRKGSDYAMLLLGHANIREAIPELKAIVAQYEADAKMARERMREQGVEENLGKRSEGEKKWILNLKFKEFYDGKYDESTVFYARMALARMGDEEQIKACIKEIYDENSNRYPTRYQDEPEKRKKLMDREIAIHSLDDYAYIRQPETVELLNKFLFSEDNDGHPDEKSGCPHKRRAFKEMAKCLLVEGLEVDSFGNPRGLDIEAFRDWMKTKYTPRLINSVSVLIDGKIVDNLAEKPAVAVKKEAPKIAVEQNESPSVQDKSGKYRLLVLFVAGAILLVALFAVGILKKRKARKKP